MTVQMFAFAVLLVSASAQADQCNTDNPDTFDAVGLLQSKTNLILQADRDKTANEEVTTQAPHQYWRVRQSTSVRWAIVELKMNGKQPTGGSCNSCTPEKPCGNAVDGDTSLGSHWDARSGGNLGNGNWWSYKFPAKVWINSVQMIQYWNGNYKVSSFVVEWSDDGSSWTKADDATIEENNDATWKTAVLAKVQAKEEAAAAKKEAKAKEEAKAAADAKAAAEAKAAADAKAVADATKAAADAKVATKTSKLGPSVDINIHMPLDTTGAQRIIKSIIKDKALDRKQERK